jgi:hypothetical protein
LLFINNNANPPKNRRGIIFKQQGKGMGYEETFFTSPLEKDYGNSIEYKSDRIFGSAPEALKNI